MTTYIAEKIEVPAEIYEKFEAMGTDNRGHTFMDALTNDGKLHDKDTFALSAGLIPTMQALFDMRKQNAKSYTLEDFSEIMSGIALAYMLGEMKWKSVEDINAPVLMPTLPNVEELLAYKKIQLRNGQVFDMEDTLAHLMQHTEEEPLKHAFDQAFPKGITGHRAEPKGSSIAACARAMFKLVDEHIAEGVEQ